MWSGETGKKLPPLTPAGALQSVGHSVGNINFLSDETPANGGGVCSQRLQSLFNLTVTSSNAERQMKTSVCPGTGKTLDR